ncbi:PEP-CTERM system TPR-repeat protein PrsT [Salinimonas marina]|uniref:PEP-CTERM system TPR-repeat protein PrsT n=1 Tax=Salinimonas marina TaxID=2785918 RepID=A0A7S9DZB2_9ALTE|nr:XrtA/PEP-CTERM system TPR-repeat protein PrsT [Salinimonas marina]QPG06423.1 PEP-CTERM system TPR-repeat protein PrsT [Salinimonas marina]
MKRIFTKKLLIAALPLAIMTGCAEQSIEEQLSQARTSIENNEYQQALIELKQTIQASPDNAEARLLLAQAYYKMGSMENAVSSFDKAMEAGAEPVKFADSYISATYAYANNDATLQTIEQLESREGFQPSAFVQIIEALVLGRQADKQEAQTIIDGLEKSQLSERDANLLSLVDQFVVNPDTADEAALAEVENKQSTDWVTRTLIAEIQYGMGATESALTNFQQLLEDKPAFLRLNFNIAESLIRLKRFDEATQYINEILGRFPNQAMANQLAAIVALAKEDFEKASNHIEKAQNAGMQSPLTSYIAGMAHFKLQNYEQAIANLEHIVTRVPANHPAKQLYIAAKLETGASSDALEIFNRSPEMVNDNAELSVITSMSLIRDGFSKGANQILSQLDGNNIKTEQQRQEVGLFKLISGDQSGLEMVRESSNRILTQEAEGNTKQAKLILLTLKANEEGEEAARAQLQQWQSEEPDNVANYLIAAEFEKYQGNYDALDEIYQKVRQLDKDNIAALNHEAVRTMEQQQFDQAYTLFADVLQKAPNDEQALKGAFLAAQNSEDPQGKTDDLVQQVTTAEDVQQYTKMYTYVLTGDFEEAIEIGKNANFPPQTKPKAEFLLARSFLQTQQYEKAEYRLNKLIESEMSTPAVHYMLARTQTMQGANDTALRTLQPLLNNDTPVSDRAILLAADIYLTKKQPGQAQTLLDKLSDQQAQTPAAQLIKGKVALANNDTGNATASLRSAYEASPNSRTVQALYQGLKKQGQQQQGFDLLEEYLAENSDSGSTREMYASELARADKQAESIKQYRMVVEANPKNWQAMNNLSWLLNQQGQQDDAYTWIKKALELKPNQKALLNTKKEIEAKM